MSIAAALRCAASIAALRRSVSTVASLASRSIRVHQSHHSLRSTSLRAIFAPRFAPFSSMVEQSDEQSDSDLLEVIKTEIKCAEECDEHDRVEEIPQGFPFDIEDEAGTNIITLKRKYKGEDIEVTVSMPSIVTGEEPEGGAVSANDDDAEIPNNNIPITVYVTKGNDMGLEFNCTGYPDEVTIDSMSIRKNQESDEEMILYEGPDFDELDENLQRALHKYLEIRGITPVVTNFANVYMINKDSREYLYWLQNLKKFVQK